MSGAGKRKAADAARRRFVGDIVERHFGRRPKHLEEKQGGLTNAVWRFRIDGADFIFRTRDDATKVDDYRKECWTMDAARTAGIPVPRVLEVGIVGDGRPYLIAEHVAGVDPRAAGAPTPPCAVLEELGFLASRIHGIATHGFGRTFDWSSNRLSQCATFADWLTDEFDVERRVALLVRQRLLDASQVAALRATATTMAAWRKRPCLQHGDLRLKNVLVDPATRRIVALLDWENASSSPPPYVDLAIALHDLGIDEKEAFLRGYGLSPKALVDALPFLRLLNVLHYADAVEHAARAQDRVRLGELRARLAGRLDLYVAGPATRRTRAAGRGR